LPGTIIPVGRSNVPPLNWIVSPATDALIAARTAAVSSIPSLGTAPKLATSMVAINCRVSRGSKKPWV